MRVLYAGSPAIAVPALEALGNLMLEPAEEAGITLVGLLTNPDSPRGRRGRPEPTDTGAAAEALSRRFTDRGLPPLPVIKPESLKGGARELAAALKPDLLVSFAYGRIFGPRFLALFPLGGINIHPSLLPRHRGPAPIPQAILSGDRETGITIQRLAPELDSGDILAQERIPLGGRETAASLSALMARKAAELLPALLRRMEAGNLEARPQDRREASYCSLIAKEDGLIDWSADAAGIDAKIRAYNPWPLSWTYHGEERLYILEAEPRAGPSLPGSPPGLVLGVDKGRGILVQTGNGVLVLKALQYQARKALEWRAFLNGARDFTGARLGLCGAASEGNG
ncbi:MAG: methionyl-tRNA formyltransferase [Treponema sp.]|nr:methionyl-tRNA formyltransferase [Treponema sp.]